MADYKIIEKIAAGGMAEVYKGKDVDPTGAKRMVAIKQILPHLTVKEEFVQMFLNEARLALYLNHQNIVSVFDIGISSGNYFLVMEFVDGIDLRKLLQTTTQRKVPIPVEYACQTIIDTCKGLAYAHGKKNHMGQPLNIVHRDISPPNILLSYEGEVKVTDFGIAKAATVLEESQPGKLKGKFGYMSPEQATGVEPDGRTDIFATGIVLYEMLANRRLFRGRNEIETLELVRRAEVPPLMNFNPDVPPQLEWIVMKSLARNLEERYAKATDMAEDLSTFLGNSGYSVGQRDLALYFQNIVPPTSRKGGALDISDLIQAEILNLTSVAKEGDGEEEVDIHAPLDLSSLPTGHLGHVKVAKTSVAHQQPPRKPFNFGEWARENWIILWAAGLGLVVILIVLYILISGETEV